jgi:hypothetical protein
VGRVGHDDEIKQGLVLVRQCNQRQITSQVGGFGFEVLQNPLGLPRQRFNRVRQQALEMIGASLFKRKRSAVVSDMIVQQRHSRGNRG